MGLLERETRGWFLHFREKLIYEEHLRQGNLKKVYWITYGDDDKRLSENLKKEKNDTKKGKEEDGFAFIAFFFFFHGMSITRRRLL